MIKNGLDINFPVLKNLIFDVIEKSSDKTCKISESSYAEVIRTLILYGMTPNTIR